MTEHEHEHHHSESHEFEVDCSWARLHLESHVHDQASTVSIRVKPLPGQTLSFADLASAMQRIAVSVEKAGGIVGHIKGYARDGDSYAHASVTAPEIPASTEGDCSATFDERAEIALVAIAMLVEENDLAQIAGKAIAEIGGAN